MTLGPFSFAPGLLTTFVALMLLLFVGKRVARKADVETALWIIAGVALLAARITFVARHARLYGAQPWSVFDIRDGGFHLLAGLGAGFACAAWLSWRRPSQRPALLAGALAGGAVFGVVALAALAMPAPNVRLPAMTLARLEGGTLALPALAGKPVVINLWASWCGPCRREMPVLRAAQLAHPEVHFIFVNQGESAADIGAYLRQQNIQLDNIVLDARPGLAHVFGSKALPTTFFFDANGVLVARRVGELSAATLADQLPQP